MLDASQIDAPRLLPLNDITAQRGTHLCALEIFPERQHLHLKSPCDLGTAVRFSRKCSAAGCNGFCYTDLDTIYAMPME